MNVKNAIRNIRNDPISLLVMFNRARGHVGILSFIMIAWMFILTTELNLIQTILMSGLGVLFLMVVDWKWIISNEQRKVAEKNPVTMEILKTVKELKHEIKEIRKVIEKA